MKTTELSDAQFVDFFFECEKIMQHNLPGGLIMNVLVHPSRGDCLLIQDGTAGVLIERSEPEQGVHDHARAVTKMRWC